MRLCADPRLAETEIADASDAWEWVRAWLRGKGSFLCVTLYSGVEMQVTRNSRRAVAIANWWALGEAKAVDASTTPELSGEIQQFKHESCWSELDRSNLISRTTLRAILEAFVLRGELSDQVYWIRE